MPKDSDASDVAAVELDVEVEVELYAEVEAEVEGEELEGSRDSRSSPRRRASRSPSPDTTHDSTLCMTRSERMYCTGGWLRGLLLSLLLLLLSV